MKKMNKNGLRRLPAGKLMLSYLSVIMVMSIIFSVVLYATSIHEFDKPPAGSIKGTQLQDPDHVLDEWIGRRSDDGKANLAIRLVALNIGTLLIGGALSYVLARRTLRPIEKSLDEQDQFIADASHELRTPITSALLSNEIALKNKSLTLIDAKAVIEGNVKDMIELKKLSDELLYETHGEQKTVMLSEVDVSHVVDDAVTSVAIIARQKGSIIKNETTPARVTTDAEKLRKVLIILIENALKYSAKGSTVTITGYVGKADVQIIVSDQGIGIDASDIPHIFHRFYRADHSRSGVAGHGLGLSIAQKYLADIDASISVKSSVNIGSAFTVKLPKNLKK